MGAVETFKLVVKYSFIAVGAAVVLYTSFLCLLATSTFQAHVVYLHKFQMTWFKGLDVPETWGFLRNQTTPFSIKTPEGESLYAWHILPLELYRKQEEALTKEPCGFVSDFQSRLAFKLLQEDPEARLILRFHGAGGTRPPNYRALSAGSRGKIHVLTFDYRGFGRRSGSPSEDGLISDALAVVDWATKVAGVPPSRILIFGQSLGTAVSIAIMDDFASQAPPVLFAGAVLVAPFVDAAMLAATYRVAGTVPLVSPLAKFPALFKYLGNLIRDNWLSHQRLASFIRANESKNEKYRLTIIHAEDDFDIPSHHTQMMFWPAVSAMLPGGITFDDLELMKKQQRIELGAAGSVMEWRTDNGLVREEILKTGLHDVVMGYPVVTMAVMCILAAADPSFA